MVVFLVVYAATLLVLSPLLNQKAPLESEIKRGDVLRPVLHRAVERVRKMPHVGSPGQVLGEGIAGAVKKKFESFRHHKGVTDAELLDKAIEESKKLRRQRHDLESRLGGGGKLSGGDIGRNKGGGAPPAKRIGFIVLGMHRSGTSMLSGLLATGMGYQTGGPLIGGAFDNAKGFFERIDVVYQNDEFMNKQQVWWNANTFHYDPGRALKMKDEKLLDFKEGMKALRFLNDPRNAPWLQKDPRMCITLKTWLPLLSTEPAVLFTYRHPLEVAMSLKKRESDFPLERGLRLWIIYNIRAVQNSAGLCIVYTSNEKVFADPLKEVQRISDELTDKCGVPPPPEKLGKEVVDRFVDPGLRHNKDPNEKNMEVIADFGDGCVVRTYDGAAERDTDEYQRERELYLKAMRMYCDFESGKAYQENYEWPELPQ